MKRSVRALFFLLTISSLLAQLGLGSIALASPLHQPAPSGTAEIDGPLHLLAKITPAVATPRDKLTLELFLTNRREWATTAEVIVTLPAQLSVDAARLPSATTFNFQNNSFNWLPVIEGGGGSQQLSILLSSVADISRPLQAIEVILREEGTETSAAVPYWVGLAPQASIHFDPPLAAVGQPVELRAVISGPGPYSRQLWTLGDGRTVSADNPTVVFASPGIYQVGVQVANPLAIASATVPLTVVSQPTAHFTVDDEMPVVRQMVQFINESGGEPPLSFLWEFGDGSTSVEPNPTHQFASPGTYSVSLVVQSEFGQATTDFPLAVGIGPVADIIVDETGLTGQVVHGQAYGDDSVTSFAWDMGDGNHYEGESVTHSYRHTGDYLVTMTAENEFAETVVTHLVQVDRGTYFTYFPLLQMNRGTAQSTETGATTITAGAAQPAQPADPQSRPQAGPAPLPGVAPEPAPAPPAPVPSAPPDTVETAPPAEAADLVPATGGAAPDQADIPIVEETFEPISLPPQAPLEEEASEAEQLLWYINEARRLHGLRPLVYNYELTVAAQLHSADMAGNADIMHDGSDGSRPAERQRRHGYSGIYGGEAVAWGFEDALRAVEFWVNSPPHRVLILNPSAREVGVGFFADGNAPNLWYWCAEFGILLDEDAPTP